MTSHYRHGVSNHRHSIVFFFNILFCNRDKKKTLVNNILSGESTGDRGPIRHNNNVIMGTIAFQITSLTIVYAAVYSDADQRKHQSSASLAFVRGIHRGPVNSPHKWPVTRKIFPFDDVIMAEGVSISGRQRATALLMGSILWNVPSFAYQKYQNFRRFESFLWTNLLS